MAAITESFELIPEEAESLSFDESFVEMVEAIEGGECSTSTSTVDGALNSRRKKRSLVWTYFHKVDDSHAKCDTCGDQIVTSGNTTNMVTVS